MQKLIALLMLVAIVITLLCACNAFTCDVCGGRRTGEKHTAYLNGEHITYCENCKDVVGGLQGMYP